MKVVILVPCETFKTKEGASNSASIVFTLKVTLLAPFSQYVLCLLTVSIVSSNASSPQCGIYCFLFQSPLSSLCLNLLAKDFFFQILAHPVFKM